MGKWMGRHAQAGSTEQPANRRLNRRRFLHFGMGSIFSTWWALAGCGRTTEQPIESTAATITSQTETPDLQTSPETSTGTSTGTESEATAAVLRIATGILPVTFDPIQFARIEEFRLGYLIYDGLVWIDETLTPQPMLAEWWDSTADGLRWTFQLRRDVLFHHDTPFTANDVVHTFTKLIDPVQKTAMISIFSFLEGVEAIDEYTVRFTLNTPNVEFLLLLAVPQARIIADDYDDELLLRDPSGTGAFRFEQLESGKQITLTRNPTYWAADQILIDEVHFVLIASLADQLTALEESAIDLLLDIDPAHLSALSEISALTVLEAPSGRYQCLTMRVHEPPFDDLRVRQALKHCVDRSALQRDILTGRGDIGYDHPIPPTNAMWADLPAPAYDVAQARTLLAEAGFEQGLTLQLLTTDAAPGMVRMAEAFGTMAAPAGIAVEVIEMQVPADIYYSDYWGRVPFYVEEWNFRPSLYETFHVAYHSNAPWNATGWTNERLDELLTAAASETDETKRREHYREIQQLMIEQGAVIIPYFQPILVGLRNHVQGFVAYPNGWLDLRNVGIVEV